MGNRYGFIFFSKIKDFSEEKVKAKLKGLPDGKWSTVHYIESLREDYLKIQASVIKEDENITIDFTGSSPVSKGSQNISKMGTISNALCAYLTMLCYDIPWSAGVGARFGGLSLKDPGLIQLVDLRPLTILLVAAVM